MVQVRAAAFELLVPDRTTIMMPSHHITCVLALKCCPIRPCYSSMEREEGAGGRVAVHWIYIGQLHNHMAWCLQHSSAAMHRRSTL